VAVHFVVFLCTLRPKWHHGKTYNGDVTNRLSSEESGVQVALGGAFAAFPLFELDHHLTVSLSSIPRASISSHPLVTLLNDKLSLDLNIRGR
jgi:hypothetical protein